MAIEMQDRLLEMNSDWRNREWRVLSGPYGGQYGLLQCRQLGSNERMDYTIIGAEVNLAARLQSSAEPGRIVMSYENHALVSDMVRAQPSPSDQMKGISREIVPYVIEGSVGIELSEVNGSIRK